MTMVSLSGIPQEYSPECFSANESPPERKGYKRDKRGKKKKDDQDKDIQNVPLIGICTVYFV